LRTMCELMCGEREAESFAPPRMYCIDNGTMIGLLGYLELGAGRVTEFDNSAIDQYLRTDQTPIIWA
ncbi:MAG: UGMP family protein, partial [Candidatus Poseidoniaceae archaeon]|nr:UGMP family protein [Candidatus Poseidoniaceae archaeon]